jgi:hypothetical protein
MDGVFGNGTLNVANETYDVFVSYSREDWRHAADIDSILRAKGLKSFFDRRNLAPGLPWVRALEQVIDAAKAVIVLIGPRGLGNTQQYERELALIRQSRDPTFPVVPVILPETTADRPFDFLNLLTWVDFSHVAKVTDAPDEVARLFAAVHGAAVPGDVAQEAICPYRGLDVFREEDAAFFFGRGNESAGMSCLYGQGRPRFGHWRQPLIHERTRVQQSMRRRSLLRPKSLGQVTPSYCPI